MTCAFPKSLEVAPSLDVADVPQDEALRLLLPLSAIALLLLARLRGGTEAVKEGSVCFTLTAAVQRLGKECEPDGIAPLRRARLRATSNLSRNNLYVACVSDLDSAAMPLLHEIVSLEGVAGITMWGMVFGASKTLWLVEGCVLGRMRWMGMITRLAPGARRLQWCDGCPTDGSLPVLSGSFPSCLHTGSRRCWPSGS
jgi:hypothetical protein